MLVLTHFMMILTHIIDNYIYPDIIDHALAQMDSIDFATRDSVSAIEKSLIGSILATNEKQIAFNIVAYLFGDQISFKLQELPAPDDITDEQVLVFILNISKLNVNQPGPNAAAICKTFDNFYREYMESINVEEVIIALFLASG